MILVALLWFPLSSIHQVVPFNSNKKKQKKWAITYIDDFLLLVRILYEHRKREVGTQYQQKCQTALGPTFITLSSLWLFALIIFLKTTNFGVYWVRDQVKIPFFSLLYPPNRPSCFSPAILNITSSKQHHYTIFFFFISTVSLLWFLLHLSF